MPVGKSTFWASTGAQSRWPRYGLDAAAEDLRTTMVALIGDIAINYLEAHGLQAQIAFARQSADSQRKTALGNLPPTLFRPLMSVMPMDRRPARKPAFRTWRHNWLRLSTVCRF